MENSDFLALIKHNKGTALLMGVLFAAFSFLFLVISEDAFKVRTDFLVTQNGSNSQDLYSLSRSAEYVSKVLGEAVYSERFIDATVETGKVSPSFLPADKKERLEEWAKTVKIQKNFELGMIQITVYSDSQQEATKISQAIGEVMTQKNVLFRAGDEKAVDVRILSGPIVEKNPSFKEIVLAIIGGLLFGMLLTFLRAFAKPQRGPLELQRAYQGATPVFPEFFESQNGTVGYMPQPSSHD